MKVKGRHNFYKDNLEWQIKFNYTTQSTKAWIFQFCNKQFTKANINMIMSVLCTLFNNSQRFTNMIRLGFRSAFVATVGNVSLKNKCLQTAES